MIINKAGDAMEKIYIYQIWFPTNSKCYIGQTNNLKRRMKQHLNSGSLICNALLKVNNWTISVLHTVKSRDEANRIEIEEIRNFNSVAPNGYNLTAGGEGATHCKETKEKIRKAHQGMHASDETKVKMRDSHLGENNHFFGQHHTEESNQKNREAKAGKSLDDMGHKLDCSCSFCKARRGDYNGKGNPMFGKKRSDTVERNRNPNTFEQYKRLKNKIAKLEKEVNHG